MRLNITSSKAMADNIAGRIAINTGINNFSDSSKVKNISDAISEEIHNASISVDTLINKMFTSTATDKFLEANGFEYGVFRKIMPSILIDKTEQTVILEPLSGVFNPIIFNQVIIPATTQFKIGNNLVLTIMEDVVIVSSDINKYMSVKIESSNNTSVSIAQNDTYRLDFLNNAILSELSLRFSEPVTLTRQYESDADFRKRIVSTKMEAQASTEGAITNAIMSIPGVIGLAYHRLYSGYADVGVLTRDLFFLGSDTNIDLVNKIAKNTLYQNAASGSKYELFNPEPIYLHLNVNVISGKYNTQFIKDLLIKVFVDNYKYSNDNQLVMEAMNTALYRLLPQDDIKVLSGSLYLPTIDAFIVEDSASFTVPLYGFPYLLSENITLNVVSNV